MNSMMFLDIAGEKVSELTSEAVFKSSRFAKVYSSSVFLQSGGGLLITECNIK